MEAQQQIKLWKEFLDRNCLTKIQSNLRKDRKVIVVDFNELSKFSVELAEIILGQPQDSIKAAEIAIEQMDLENSDNVEVRFDKLPKDQEVNINRINCKTLGKFNFTKGVVITRTKVYPQIESAKFVCPNCGNDITVLQLDTTFKEPSKCGCGRKGKFNLVSKELQDTIMLKLEELPERLIGSEQPNNIRVMLQGGLCERDYGIHLGARIEVNGYIEEIPVKTNQVKSVSCDYLFHAFNYKNLDYIDFDTKISKEEQALFDEIKRQKNPARFISKLIFPDIYGHQKVKEGIINQQFGGTRYKERRDYMHVLLYGHPSTAKTDLALRVAQINPISKISTGTNISNVGLTVSVKKDELTGNWMCVGGLLVRCNGGLAVIDEIEKMDDHHKKALHTPMEHGFAPIDKAGISGKLVTNTSILATANQKVDENELKVVGNLDLPAPIIDRFDLIFEIEDYPDRKKDLKVAEKITERATFEEKPTTFNGNSTTFGDNLTTFEYNDTTFTILSIRKYIYISKKIQPKLSRRVEQTIHSWYVELRQLSMGEGYENKKPTARVVESILRLARAITRSKMKDTITQKELQLAMSFFDFVYDKHNTPNVVEEDVLDKEETKQEETPKIEENKIEWDDKSLIFHNCSYPDGKDSQCGDTPCNEYNGMNYCKKHFEEIQK